MKKRMTPMSEWFKRHATLLKILFFGVVLFFVANQVTHIAQGMSWHEVWQTIQQQDQWSLLGMLGAGLAGVVPMLLYDYVAIRTLEDEGRPRMDVSDWLIAAWTTNTINNLAGFGGVVGASLRASFYGKNMERKKVLATVSKIALFMLSGLSILAFITALDLFLFRQDNPFVRYRIWLLLGGVFAPLLGALVYSRRKTLFKEFKLKRIVILFLASLGQWLGALAVFLTVGHLMGIELAISAVYPMFIIATGFGMLTMIPGGAGTFDVMMILGLGHLGLSQSQAVVWILFYRVFYYLLPFLSGILIFLTSTSVRMNRYFDNLPRILSQKAAHAVLVCAVYFAGIMMILLSTFTNLSNLSRLFEVLLPYSFDFLDQTLNLLVGFLLLGLARGIAEKVRKAFWPTIVLLVFGIVNTVSKTASLRLIVAYLIVLLIVWASRKEFSRKRFVYSWGALIVDGLIFGILFIFYAVAGYHSGQFWRAEAIPNRYFAFPSEEIWVSGIVGLILSILCLALLYQYLTQGKEELGTAWDEKRFSYLINRYGGTAAGHYLRLPGYTYYYYQENGNDQIVFGFQTKANKCFVLGNPIGNREKWQAATIAFLEHADRLGYQLAFYKISDDYVLLLHDLGFHFDKIGENGVTDFRSHPREVFSDRFEFKRLTNEGYQFIYFKTIPDEVYEEMREISEEWLNGEKEKHFSVGRFDRAYLDASQVGIVRDPANRIVGFISKQPIDANRSSYDLLRYRNDVPKELPTFLKLQLMDEMKRQGVQQVYQGMAPLAKVGETSYSFLGERIMNLIYKYGNSFYAFQQVTEEKTLYVDYWRPRYFAYMKSSSFLFSALQLLLLIGRGKNKGAALTDEMIEV
ncbi:phosphatidylglycerol lysyltransferase [Enterococcus sp. 665A]|uniref:Phosphatidylglycerol lysyltransferase n=2 Tax=Candidatus Enterococcus ferrettii TaxID=2815324 RepID=A0ABV0EL52_9ENTE